MANTIFDLFLKTAQKYPKNKALLYKKGHHFESLTYSQLEALVFGFGSGLQSLGVEKGNRVAIISENRPEWVIADLALMAIGAISVPIHKVFSGPQIVKILAKTQPKVVIISDQSVLEKLVNAENFEGLPEHFIICEDVKISAFKDFADKFGGIKISNFKTVVSHQLRKFDVQNSPKDIATILYTSGTGGEPKGVVLTHQNLASNVNAIKSIVKVISSDKFLSILPLSHIFERTVGYYVPLSCGATISYIEDPRQFGTVIKEEKPSIVLGVPRLYEKIYDKIMGEVSKNPLKKALFEVFLWLAETLGEKSAVRKFLESTVFSKIEKGLGGQIRFFVSGAAPLPEEIGRFFKAIGIKILEGYGLTETSPVVSCNTLENINFGTVGKPLPGIDVKIASDGEILVKGASVMAGYYQNEQATKAAFSEDGWFKTGDLGELDKRGYLKIIGRKKDIIVLSTGKKVSPALVEEGLEKNVYISQSLVFGEGKKFTAALIVPEWEEVFGKFGKKSKTELVQDEKLHHFFEKEITDAQEHLAEHEKAKKFIILPHEFSIENGMLTPTLKPRRHVIFERYEREIKELYV